MEFLGRWNCWAAFYFKGLDLGGYDGYVYLWWDYVNCEAIGNVYEFKSLFRLVRVLFGYKLLCHFFSRSGTV